MLAAPSSVWAADPPIQVLSERSLARFAEGLDFNLELEGQSRIVQVRLNYRIAGSRVWAYIYPEFTLARRVSASTRIPTSGRSYLPPGTELEYYYSVQDEEGSVHRTGLSSLLYRDQRFAGFDLYEFFHLARSSPDGGKLLPIQDRLQRIREKSRELGLVQ